MKNKNYPKYVLAMHLMDEGQCADRVCRELHIGTAQIRYLRHRYLQGGEQSLLLPEYQPHLSAEEKYACIAEVVSKELSLLQASVKHNQPYEN